MKLLSVFKLLNFMSFLFVFFKLINYFERSEVCVEVVDDIDV